MVGYAFENGFYVVDGGKSEWKCPLALFEVCSIAFKAILGQSSHSSPKNALQELNSIDSFKAYSVFDDFATWMPRELGVLKR